MLTEPWFSAWRKLLTNRVAIRSSLEFKLGSSRFDTKLFFMDSSDASSRIYRMRFKRTLGDDLKWSVTRLGEFNQPLETFLKDQHDLYFADMSSRIADLSLEPVSHVAVVTQLYASDKFLLPPSHPLLMLHYGMVYEGLLAREKHPLVFYEDVVDVQTYTTVLGILRRRFGAFLWQQEAISAENTLGQIP